MEIDCIFDERLYAFRYKNEKKNEYARLLDLWDDLEYLNDFYEQNKKYFEDEYFSYGYSIYDFIEDIESDKELLDEFISEKIENYEENLDYHFAPLSDTKKVVNILSLHKKRLKHIRLYAIRIDQNIFIITGGAIKITKDMQSHPNTKNEIAKLNYAQQYLSNEGIKGEESFYKLINFKKK